MKKFLRKRGADTNQNIFYLVIAVIVLAAAAFGLDQAFRAMNRSDARSAAASVSSQVRALFANVGVLPTGMNTATVLNADVLPSNIVNRNASGVATAIVLPNGGSVPAAGIAISGTDARDFTVNYTWGATPSGRARGICNSLIAGATVGPIGTGSRVESGPLGLDYTVLSANCAANAGIVAHYFR